MARKLKNVAPGVFASDLQSILQNIDINAHVIDVNDLLALYESRVCEVLDIHAPQRKIKLK